MQHATDRRIAILRRAVGWRTVLCVFYLVAVTEIAFYGAIADKWQLSPTAYIVADTSSTVVLFAQLAAFFMLTLEKIK